MALTPAGLPYPVGTDKVVDGDDAIKALATALDPHVYSHAAWHYKGSEQQIAANTYVNWGSIVLPATAPPGRWLVDVSLMTWTDAGAGHSSRVRWGTTEIFGAALPASGLANQDVIQARFYIADHPGGAITVYFDASISAGGGARVRAASHARVTYAGVIPPAARPGPLLPQSQEDGEDQ